MAEEANFTRAAQRVRISQSGVSAQIRQLERELGAQLFDRSSRLTRLTAAGQAALEPARDVLAAARAVGAAVDDVGGLLRGRLAIGMVVGCTMLPLFDAMEKFHDSYPGVEMIVQEDDSERMLTSVRSGDLDVAIVGTAGPVADGLLSSVIVDEGLVALVPSGHRWADRTCLTVADLDGEPVVAMPTGTGIRAVFDITCEAAGIVPRIVVESSAGDAVVEIASRGLGIGILSASMGHENGGRVKAIPVVDAAVSARLSAVWTDPADPAVRAFVPLLNEAFAL